MGRQDGQYRLYPMRVDVVAADMIVASHGRVFDRGHTAYDWQHYIDLVQRKPGALRNGTPFMDLPEALANLRRALIRRSGGDRGRLAGRRRRFRGVCHPPRPGRW